MTTNTSSNATPNPRKFAEKIALLKAKEAESTAQFDHVMRGVAPGGTSQSNHHQMPNPDQQYMDPRYAQQQSLAYAGSVSTSAIPSASSSGMVSGSGNQMPSIHPGGFGNLTQKGRSSGCIPSSVPIGPHGGPMRSIWEGVPSQASSGMHPSSANTSLSSGAGLLSSDSPKIYASNSLPNFPMAMMGGSQGSNIASQQQVLPAYSQSPPLSLGQQSQATSTQPQQQQHHMQSMSRGSHPQNLNLQQQHQQSNNSGVDLQGALHSLENIKTGGRQYVKDQLNKRIMKHMSNTNTVAALAGSRSTSGTNACAGGSSTGGGSPHHHHHHHNHNHHNHHHHGHHHHLISHAVPTGNQSILGAQRQRSNASTGSPNLGSPTSTNHRLSGSPCVGLPTPPPGGYTAALLGSDNGPPPPPPYQLETPQFSGVFNDNWRRTASDSAIHTSVLQQQPPQSSDLYQLPHQQSYPQSQQQQTAPYLHQQQQQQSISSQQPLLLPTLLGASNPLQLSDQSASSYQSTSPTGERSRTQLDNGDTTVKRCPSGPVYSVGDNGLVGVGHHNNITTVNSGSSSIHPSMSGTTMVGSLPDLSVSSVPHQALHSMPYQNPQPYAPPVSSYAGPNSVPASVPLCHTSNPTSPSSDAGVSHSSVMKPGEAFEQQQQVHPAHPNSPHSAMHLAQQQFERFNMNDCDSPPVVPVSMSVDSTSSIAQSISIQSNNQDMTPLSNQQRMQQQQLSNLGPEAMIEMTSAGRIPDIILTEPEVERRDSFNLTREVLSSLGCTSDSLDNMMDFSLPQTDVDQLLDVDDSDLELLNDTAGLVHYVADPAIEEQLRKEHKQLHQL